MATGNPAAPRSTNRLNPIYALWSVGAVRAGLYELLAYWHRGASDWRFMNFGYAFDAEADNPPLSQEDEAERYCAQLYHAVASQADLTGKQVLEVGSGRGGGASHIHRYLKPAGTIGLDITRNAVAFCERVYADVPGLSFQQGDAMALPFADEHFDAVVNVESSHCYPDKGGFFTEVMRVLKPGGRFLYADMARSQQLPDEELEAAGFTDIRSRWITANVVRALEADHQRRLDEINRRFPFGSRKLATLWAGTKGSSVFRDFTSGRIGYFIAQAGRPE